MDYMTLVQIIERLEAVTVLPGVIQEDALEALVEELIVERDYIEMDMARQSEFDLEYEMDDGA
tara:strand:+ start:261 stop:449 length:189 start_codon:yes stop_codon:yes gene_type:complete